MSREAAAGGATWPPSHAAIHLAAWALCLLYAAMAAAAWLRFGHPWFLNAAGQPTVQDFLAYRIAGSLALEGRPEAAYDPDAFTQVLAMLTGGWPNHWLGWPYPPFFILLVMPLAVLPYSWAWMAWLSATAALLLAMLWSTPGLRRHAVLVFAAPASFACIIKGQNGFLSAALLTGALVLLDKRPRLAGICLGLLAFKPHFGLVLPVLLAVTRRWTVFLSAAATVAVCIAASVLAFGGEIWPLFIRSASGATAGWMSSGNALPLMQTIYAVAAIRYDPMVAALLHGLVAALAMAAVLRVWLVPVDMGARAAAAIAATFLVTPYAHNHDAVMLGVAAAFLLGETPPAHWRWELPCVIVALLLPAISLLTWWGLPSVAAATILLLLALRRCGAAWAA